MFAVENSIPWRFSGSAAYHGQASRVPLAARTTAAKKHHDNTTWKQASNLLGDRHGSQVQGSRDRGQVHCHAQADRGVDPETPLAGHRAQRIFSFVSIWFTVN